MAISRVYSVLEVQIMFGWPIWELHDAMDVTGVYYDLRPEKKVPKSFIAGELVLLWAYKAGKLDHYSLGHLREQFLDIIDIPNPKDGVIPGMFKELTRDFAKFFRVHFHKARIFIGLKGVDLTLVNHSWAWDAINADFNDKQSMPTPEPVWNFRDAYLFAQSKAKHDVKGADYKPINYLEMGSDLDSHEIPDPMDIQPLYKY